MFSIRYTLLIISSLILMACQPKSFKTVESAIHPTTAYEEARNEMASENWTTAVELLQKIQIKYPFTKYAEQSLLDIGYSYYKNEDNALAINTLNRFIETYPNHEHLDYALYLKGLVYFNDSIGFFARLIGEDPSQRDPGGAENAFKAYKVLVARFPTSKYAADSLARMNYLINTLAKHEVQIGQYYEQKESYLAAINRYQKVIQFYHQSQFVKEALLGLISCYQAVKLPDNEREMQAIYDLNFGAKKVKNK
jgi:outer membrane protein assembly factor BamD